MSADGSQNLATAISEPNSGGAANLRPFQPGQSGNPRGRPKRDLDIAALAREYTSSALATLAGIMEDETAPPSARVAAAMALLNRGWGRRPQSLDVKLSLADEFEAFVRQLQRDED